MRKRIEWLRDILEAIEQIEKYTIKGEKEYSQNELIQKWMVYHLQVIGEAASKITHEIQNKNSHIPWSQIVGLRNIIVHEYFGIDLEEIWNTVIIDIPKLKIQVLKIIEELK
ncbi:MAG: HepT-like ribonuclease domain-containing protein [Ignavibacteriaceae bacterium]